MNCDFTTHDMCGYHDASDIIRWSFISENRNRSQQTFLALHYNDEDSQSTLESGLLDISNSTCVLIDYECILCSNANLSISMTLQNESASIQSSMLSNGSHTLDLIITAGFYKLTLVVSGTVEMLKVFSISIHPICEHQLELDYVNEDHFQLNGSSTELFGEPIFSTLF